MGVMLIALDVDEWETIRARARADLDRYLDEQIETAVASGMCREEAVMEYGISWTAVERFELILDGQDIWNELPAHVREWDKIRSLLSETVARAKQGFDYVTYPEFAVCIDKLQKVVERSAPKEVPA
ncbi:MAG: hypothetical protein HC933_09700 [Pleurocapsa sp. SU_196_0]|nr:hypothetical protein [Pleurocapsa sp. SU_196_0]